MFKFPLNRQQIPWKIENFSENQETIDPAVYEIIAEIHTEIHPISIYVECFTKC